MEDRPSRTKRRVRRSSAEIEEILASFERSGLTQQSFCRKHELCVATFSNWRRKVASGSGGIGALRPVRLTGDPTPSTVAVRFPSGIEVFFGEGSSPTEIVAIVRSLDAGEPC